MPAIATRSRRRRVPRLSATANVSEMMITMTVSPSITAVAVAAARRARWKGILLTTVVITTQK